MSKTVFFLIALLFLSCGKEDASPSNSITSNTAAVQINGVAFLVDASRSEAIIDATFGDLTVILRASPPNETRVVFHLAEFKKKPEKFSNLPSQSISTIDLIEVGPGGTYYAARTCDLVSREIEILSYDTGKKTVSGRFSGKMCFGTPNTAFKMATGGQFNLPYRVE